MENSFHNWQQIIWREWRHNNDSEYAERLFELVADEPVGWGVGVSLILLSAISGASLGILIVAPITFEWAILQQLAIAGSVIGAARGYLLNRQLTWRDWLRRLESNTPTGSLSKLVGGVLVMALIGGMLFGPVFWLMMAGLFWAIGGVITWIRSGLEETYSYNPQDRRWWFWWRNRPHLSDVQAAIEQASAMLPAAGEIWNEPLHRLSEAQGQPASPDELTKALLSNDWVERFVARHTLVMLGREAIFPLQALATKDTTPLKDTARRLLQNIERSSS